VKPGMARKLREISKGFFKNEQVQGVRRKMQGKPKP